MLGPHSLMQRWAIDAIASGLVPDIIVDSDHMIAYLKYAATWKLLDKKGDERSADQRLSAVSAVVYILCITLTRD
jgi:hypothetical protein